MFFRLFLLSAVAVGVQSGSLRRTSSRDTERLSSLVANSQFKGVVDELATGTPAQAIHLKVSKLLITLNKRGSSVRLTCQQDLVAITKASKVEEALQALDAATGRASEASLCMKKNNATIHEKQQEMAKLMSKMVLPEMYYSLSRKQANITAKLTELSAKHEVREEKFRVEQTEHTEAHEAVDSVIEILNGFYSTKGMAPPTAITGTVTDLQVKVPPSLLELVHRGKSLQSAAEATRLLNDPESLKELVQTNHVGEIESDQPKKKKVAGTLWKAMWMLKNTMLNDTAIMHERHQLRTDHSKTKMDKFSDELTDVIAQTKVLREEDKAIQQRIGVAMAEAKAAEVRIHVCKEKLSEANAEERDAEQTANRKKMRIDKTTHLCKTQLQHIEDEIALGKYVQGVIDHTVVKLEDDDGPDAAAAASSATGAATRVATGAATGLA
jgi:hypothetical protein